MAAVRQFLNSDLPDVVRVWNSHHESGALAYPATASQFYTAVMDRQVFAPENLYVAIAEDRVAGFLHMPMEGETPRVVGVWVEQVANADPIALALLDHAKSHGANKVGLTLADRAGYVGLTPYIGLVGVADADNRQTRWLKASGFHATDRHACVQISIPTFRSPVDRRVLLLRRSCTLEEVPFTRAGDSQRESGWGYLDPIQLQLRDRQSRPLAEIIAWTSGFGEIFPYSDVLLTHLHAFPGAPDGSDLLLVAEALRELANRRFLIARTAVDDGHPADAAFWQSLGFRITASGAVYSSVS